RSDGSSVAIGCRKEAICFRSNERAQGLAAGRGIICRPSIVTDAPSQTECSMTTTHGSAKWQGGIKDGKGAISTKSGALKDYPYGFASRFEGKPGSNPEELIGAAHAACFTMALSLILGEAKLTAEQMETKAD